MCAGVAAAQAGMVSAEQVRDLKRVVMEDRRAKSHANGIFSDDEPEPDSEHHEPNADAEPPCDKSEASTHADSETTIDEKDRSLYTSKRLFQACWHNRLEEVWLRGVLRHSRMHGTVVLNIASAVALLFKVQLILKHFLKYNVDLNATNSFGYTALHWVRGDL
mgnify:FL=1